MKRIIFYAVLMVLLAGSFVFAQGQQQKDNSKPRLLLMISEQNIQGPSSCWWLSEIDLSTIESNLSRLLIEQGYQILEPSVVNKIVKKEKAFRVVEPNNEDVVHLGKLSKADYVLLGRAVASAGGNVAGSNMRSCFANATVKLVRVKDGQVIAYLDAAGSTVHPDVITGGKEALTNAAVDLASKVISNLTKEEGGK